MIAPRLFGTNGIRGIVGREINADLAYRVGSGVGVLYKRGSIVVGRDGRLSSQMLCEGLVAGLLAQGCDVTDLGLITTPALQFLVRNEGAGAGVMVTASHNPSEYNGFKVVDSDGVEISRKKEEKVEKLVHQDLWMIGRSPGRRVMPVEAMPAYFASLKTHLGKDAGAFRDLKIVVDAGNGVSVLTTPALLRELHCQVLTINDNIDGKFPGRPSEPRPETLSTLSRLVREERADVGVAHDGDGDRAIFADENGTVQWGDRTFALVEDEVLSEHPGARVVTPVNSSMAVEEIAKKRRGKLVLTKVGSIYVSRTMMETGAVLGGEENGGIFYAPHHPVRDGTMAVLLVLKAMVRNRKPLSKLLARLPKFAMAKEKFECEHEGAKKNAMARLKSKLGKRVSSELDGLRVNVKDRGWILVRPSGTEPLIRLYAEGRTEKDLFALMDEFKPMVQEALNG